MSSDYIPRLRAELLRAGATSTARRRPRPRVLRPLAVGVTVAALVAAIVIAMPQARNDERSADPAATVRLDYALPEAAAPIVRARLDAAGVQPAAVSASAAGVTVVVPERDRTTVPALLVAGQLAIYDWEASVLGPDGKPHPTSEDVTGGQDAGRSASLTRAQAELRAGRREGAVLLRSENDPDRWFALAGPPALTNAHVTRAEATVDPVVHEPVVELELNRSGARAFLELTRTLGQRGADNALGGDPLETSQHFAMVVDGRIVSVPFINWRENPDGIDGDRGIQIAGGLTRESASTLAAVLGTGPLP